MHSDHKKQDYLTGHEHSLQSFENSPEFPLSTVPASVGHGGHEEIAALAHQLWQDRGRPIGSPDDDWFHASEQLRHRIRGS